MATRSKVEFQSSASAIRALKVGKRNPNWVDAAEYLIERASPEVKLLLEATQEIERSKWKTDDPVEKRTVTTLFSPMQWFIMFLVGTAFTGFMIWVGTQFGIGGC